MKWLPLILALYFLGLALITCTDGNVVTTSGDTEQVVLAADTHAGHDHPPLADSFDGCSPLCTCHCCHMHINYTDMVQVNPILDDITGTPSYLNNFQDIDHFDFFVPPRA